MNKFALSKILTGFIVGLIATVIGCFLWITFFSDFNIKETIHNAIQFKVLGAILSAGALLNMLAFFLFLKQKKTYQARGVLLATLLIALMVIYLKLT